jgi:hypothetical protein
MADDWQPGDIALCVSDAPHWSDQESPIAFTPRVGARYTVTRYGLCRFGFTPLIGLAENPNGWDWGHVAARFIKVTPDEADAEDAEIIRLLTGAPAKEPVS